MTTDELLEKLPSHIGRNAVYDKNNVPIGYSYDTKQGLCVGWLHLCNEGGEWSAYYGNRGKFLCMNPDINQEKALYNNAIAYGKTPNQALQNLYNWCIKNKFIKL